MSDFGPPGGSPETWRGRRPDDRYSPPVDPRYDPGYGPQPGGWGEPPAQRYEPAVGWDTEQPAYLGQPAYPGQPVDDAAPARPERGKGPLVAVLVVLAMLALGGAGAYWVLGRDEPATVSGSGAPAGAAGPTAEASGPAVPATTAPAPASSTDSRFVNAGQCVRNESADGQDPKLVISECGPKTYQVLRRIDGATSGKTDAEAKCAKVEGYTDWYFYNSELDALDFVLCLKRR